MSLPPVTYAGLRYFIAFLCFIPFILKKKYSAEIRHLHPDQWKNLIFLGLMFYTFTQGAQFIGLSLLPSVTVSLMLNFTPLIVAVIGIFVIHEKPSMLQWIGSLMFIAGIFIYFLPVSLYGNQGFGIFIMVIGVLANAGSAILGRGLNRNRDISPLVITFISMGTGAIILILTGFCLDGFPDISLQTWGYLLWLAIVNTAFAFTLWNITLRTISAVESSIINGTMLIQIAVLAWFYLGESISFQEGIGMLIAAVGVVFVQIKGIAVKKMRYNNRFQ